MMILAILSLGLAVVVGMPPFAPDLAQRDPVLTEKQQSPLLGDVVPLQGHVVVEDPAPQVRPFSREQQEKTPPETDQSTLHVQVKRNSIKDLENEVKLGDKVDPEQGKAGQQGEMERDVNIDQKAKADTEDLNPEVMAELEVKVKSEVKIESEPDVGPNVNLESEVKEPEVKQMFSDEQEAQIEFQMETNHKEETELDDEESHIDMEGKYEMRGEAIMNSELQGDDSTFVKELQAEEESTFQSPDVEPLTEEEGIVGRSSNASDEGPIMELEPETGDEPVLHEGAMPGSALMDEGPALDIMGQPLTALGDYFSLEESPEVSMLLSEEPTMENRPLLDKATGRYTCSGVILDRKCYQFFKEPKRATDAEFFCQQQFFDGHLASITSQQIHRHVMNLILQQNGAYTRTWIGGLRYLETGRFIWLDGSHWGYADWLSGEPNNTAGVEDCLEVLAIGNGKFNDFTCWEPQAFICSYPYY